MHLAAGLVDHGAEPAAQPQLQWPDDLDATDQDLATCSPPGRGGAGDLAPAVPEGPATFVRRMRASRIRAQGCASGIRDRLPRCKAVYYRSGR